MQSMATRHPHTGAPKRLYVCTGCIKSGKIVKAG